MNNPDDPIGEDPDPTAIANAAARDTRTTAQRNHDALKRICEITLESGQNGTHRGLPVTAIITMTLDQLEEAAGVATTATGGCVPVADALTLAEKTRPWLAIFDHASRPLHLGRSKRLASAEQRLMLIPFDRGCTRPGCNASPSLCAVHHPVEWADGGATDIDNETFACDPCHALVNASENGWQTRKAGPGHAFPGRTEWIPPKHIDPDRKPRLNHRQHPVELLDRAIRRSRRDGREPPDDDAA